MDTLIFDHQLLDRLIEQAAQTPRLRVNLDLRNSPNDSSQRMLNALIPGTRVPIHRHPTSSETIVLLRGRATEIIYADDGTEQQRIELDTGSPGMQIAAGAWHTIVAHEPTVIIEVKDGPYRPLDAADMLPARPTQ